MKLMMCEICYDMVAPARQARRPRCCECKVHWVWWENPATGVLRVYSGEYAGYMKKYQRPYPPRPYVWIIGISNTILHHEGQITKDDVKAMIAAHPDSYIFKRIESLVIRIRPGESSDTAWATELPEWPVPSGELPAPSTQAADNTYAQSDVSATKKE